MSKPQQRSCNTRMTSRSSLQNTGKATEVSGVSACLTDTPACCPQWGATTAGAARHPEQTVDRLLLLARLYVALQHCPLGHIFIPAGGLCPGVTVVECRIRISWLGAAPKTVTRSWVPMSDD